MSLLSHQSAINPNRNFWATSGGGGGGNVTFNDITCSTINVGSMLTSDSAYITQGLTTNLLSNTNVIFGVNVGLSSSIEVPYTYTNQISTTMINGYNYPTVPLELLTVSTFTLNANAGQQTISVGSNFNGTTDSTYRIAVKGRVLLDSGIQTASDNITIQAGYEANQDGSVGLTMPLQFNSNAYPNFSLSGYCFGGFPGNSVNVNKIFTTLNTGSSAAYSLEVDSYRVEKF